MPGLLGMLNMNDGDRTPVNNVGQRRVYEAVRRYINEHNANLQRAYDFFVAERTPLFKELFALPSSGRLARRGRQTQSPAVKMAGEWDVAYPLESFGNQVAVSRADLAYMSISAYDAHVESIRLRDINERRIQMLNALLNNAVRTFRDPRPGVGTLTIQPLANGDDVIYPNVSGGNDGTTADHYDITGYVAADMDETNNPIKTARNMLQARFGEVNAVVVMNSDDADIAAATLPDFLPLPDQYVSDPNAATLRGVPQTPGNVIGRSDRTWIVAWDHFPVSYLFARDLRQSAPLVERSHTPESGEPIGLQLVAETDGDDSSYPLITSHWEDDFGYGVRNRANGVVLQFAASGSYTPPDLDA